MNEPVLQFLGIARKAQKLAMGHDMALQSLQKKKAWLCLLSTDASQRLEREFSRAAEGEERRVPVLRTPYTINEYHQALGYKAGVFTVNDEGFAKKLMTMLIPMQEEETDL